MHFDALCTCTLTHHKQKPVTGSASMDRFYNPVEGTATKTTKGAIAPFGLTLIVFQNTVTLRSFRDRNHFLHIIQ